MVRKHELSLMQSRLPSPALNILVLELSLFDQPSALYRIFVSSSSSSSPRKKKGGITIGILRLSHLVAHTILSCRQRASHLQNNTSLAFSCLVNAPLLCCKTDILKKCLLGKKSVITLEYVSHSLERRSKIQTSGRTKPCVRRCLASLRL